MSILTVVNVYSCVSMFHNVMKVEFVVDAFSLINNTSSLNITKISSIIFDTIHESINNITVYVNLLYTPGIVYS